MSSSALSFVEAFHEGTGLPEEQSDVRGIAGTGFVKQGTGDKLFSRPKGLSRHRRPSPTDPPLAVGRPDFCTTSFCFPLTTSCRDSPARARRRRTAGSRLQWGTLPIQFRTSCCDMQSRRQSHVDIQQLALEQRALYGCVPSSVPLGTRIRNTPQLPGGKRRNDVLVTVGKGR